MSFLPKKKTKEQRRKYAKTHYTKHLSKIRVRNRDFARDRRVAVLKFYSGGKMLCGCCGESEIKFLCIDHINGGGSKHRKNSKLRSIYQFLVASNFPDGFQVLCHNCNCAKGFYGKCPHKE